MKAILVPLPEGLTPEQWQQVIDRFTDLTENHDPEFRQDGWPHCFACGEDELASLILLDGSRFWKKDREPTRFELLMGGFRCYACHSVVACIDLGE